MTVMAVPVESAQSRQIGNDPCPHTGRWALCSLERRLRQAGFVLKPVTGESQKRVGFSVAPVVYTLGQGRLEVFIYEDSASLARDLIKVDTVATPVIRSANLAAIYLGDNARQAERLALAITAGAPQPGSPR